MAIDRDKLIARLERFIHERTDDLLSGARRLHQGAHYFAQQLLEEIRSGTFDIKPREGRTGQPLRIPGEPGWEEPNHD